MNNFNEIYFFGENKFNTKLVTFLSQNQIVAHFFYYYGYYSASLIPKRSKLSGKLLVKQVENYSNDEKRLIIAKSIVKGAGKMVYRNLRYYNGRGKDVGNEMKEIGSLLKRLELMKSVNETMGIEGNIHKIYYSAWTKIINQEIDFEKRVKRPPDNMINTLISFVNSLVYATTISEIYKTQLDTTISYLHEPGVRRHSLSLDIAEIFKPLIGDRLIFSLLNKNQITEKHFTKGLEYLNLSEKGSKIIVEEFDRRLRKTIIHKDLGKEVSYRYLIRLECYKIIKHLFGEKEYEPFEIWW